MLVIVKLAALKQNYDLLSLRLENILMECQHARQ